MLQLEKAKKQGGCRSRNAEILWESPGLSVWSDGVEEDTDILPGGAGRIQGCLRYAKG
jgi:hypothetical protein